MYFGFAEDGGAGKGGGGRSYRKAAASQGVRTSKKELMARCTKSDAREKQEECRHLTTWAQGQEGPLERQDALRAMWGIWATRSLGRISLRGL